MRLPSDFPRDDITFSGDLTLCERSQIVTAFARLTSPVVDLSRVGYIDAFFIAQLVEYSSRPHMLGRVAVVAARQPYRILTMLHLEDCFDLVLASTRDH